MIQLKKIKLNPKTAVITLVSDSEARRNPFEENEIIALSLLLGSFNSLRKYTDNDCPINIEYLNEKKEEFNTIIQDIRHTMKLTKKVEF